MKLHKPKTVFACSMTILTLSTTAVPSLNTAVYATENNFQTTAQIKSWEDKTIAELINEATPTFSNLNLPLTINEKAGSQNAIASALEKKVMTMTVREVQNNIESLMKEFDGANYSSRNVAGVGGKIQNGGWNMYYKSSAGKKSVYNFYDRLVIGAAGNVLYNVIVDTLATTCGITVAGAVIIAISNLISLELIRKSASARGLVSGHGNTGTIRVTLSDELWSSKYNASW
ncbi:hypothetical protein IGJ66_001338 [Enterococcus sp. DIV0176]|uniref:hypothetical protein n=1 Tax=Enterococcus sp. DIV0176 TaxID=2774758 RepID=UPI003D2FF225